jgi:excisionase family DNA binding protein
MDGMLTLKEVIDYLDIEQSDIEKLVKKGRLNAYKIGGTYLRFKKDQVVQLKAEILNKKSRSRLFLSKARDYWYFNRVYILSAVLLALIFCLFIQ